MLTSFEYIKLGNLAEILEFLKDHGKETKIIAGGTDLLVQMRKGTIRPKFVLDISGIKEFGGITKEDEEIHVGSLVTIGAVEASPVINQNCPLFSEGAKLFGFWQLKNMASIGGNLCNASPAADMATPLLSLSAKVRLLSSSGSKVIPMEDFFLGPGKSALGQNEVLAEIIVPKILPGEYFHCLKLGKRAGHILSVVNVSVLLSVDGGLCKRARLALGSVAPTPKRAITAEARLVGSNLDDEAIEDASALVLKDISPISDVRASAEYRRDMAVNLTKRAIKSALAGAR